LGRLARSKFSTPWADNAARPIWNPKPLPTEKGVLTVRGHVYTAYTCEEESFKITEAIDLSIRMAETAAHATQIPPDQLQIPEQETPRKSSKSKEHKEVQLVDGSPNKTALIGADLDPK